MKVGDRVYINRELEMFGRIYTKGHQFIITGSSYRGWDLIDDDGNKVTETLFISDSIKSLSEERNIKINEILKK